MFSKVRVRKGALDYFRKLARKSSPLEIQAYLIGKIISVDIVEIVSFAYTKIYAIQTTGSVAWTQENFDKLKEKVESEGYRIVGEIHSHPEWDAVMSGADYNANVTAQLVVCGICSINNNRTRVRFWTPTSALPCKIMYV